MTYLSFSVSFLRATLGVMSLIVLDFSCIDIVARWSCFVTTGECVALSMDTVFGLPSSAVVIVFYCTLTTQNGPVVLGLSLL